MPHHQSELLDAALRKAGVSVRFVTIPGGPHGGDTVTQGAVHRSRLARLGAPTLTSSEAPRGPLAGRSQEGPGESRSR